LVPILTLDDSGSKPNLSTTPSTCFLAIDRNIGGLNVKNGHGLKREPAYLDPHMNGLSSYPPLNPIDRDGGYVPNHLGALTSMTQVLVYSSV
jgi:hypothetical protein